MMISPMKKSERPVPLRNLCQSASQHRRLREDTSTLANLPSQPITSQTPHYLIPQNFNTLKLFPYRPFPFPMRQRASHTHPISQLLAHALYTIPYRNPPVPGPSDRARAAAIHTETIDCGMQDVAPPDAPLLSPVSPVWSADCTYTPTQAIQHMRDAGVACCCRRRFRSGRV